MSSINEKATITLQVNGQQAKQMLRDTEQQIAKTEKAIEKMQKAGADPKAVRRQEKNLRELRAELERMQRQVNGVEDVFSNLDKATPKQLKAELKKLKKELDGLQPGTKVWDEHKEKIRHLEERLRALGGQVRAQQSLWDKFKGFIQNTGVAIVAIIGAYSQAIPMMRKYVGDYATMDEQLANSVKYTRMSREEVEKLNEAFKKIDTRLGREQLNELAQEAGRLGKNTIESVQGYVEAAQIINVALVDLGQGATQSIAKIANIFGVEQMYGTKEAMLKVGSAVNHLSQNCTASKPYLVNFAQRMSGIGSTAKMTIPEILAFGAVLDANGQKVEMSSTAISNTIMKLFQQTSKFAEITGMDVQKFSEVLNRNTTEGLLMFLDQLKKVSGGSEAKAIAALAPLFKDLGLNGARITQVIATLTQHMGELRWQIGEANQAFREGKSATNEFVIFNNTAQAKIDKAKNRIHELSVELGEKLSPVMAHVSSTTSMLFKAMNVVADHVIKHAGVYSALARTIGTYVGALALAKVGQLAYTAAVSMSTKVVTAFKGVMTVLNALLPVFRLAMVGIGNAVSFFTNGLNVNYAMQQRWSAATARCTTAMKALNATMKANLFAAVATAVVALVVAIKSAKEETSEFRKAVKEAMRNTEGMTEAALKEKEELQDLFGVLRGGKKGTEEYEGAKKKLIDQYGVYIRGLINEKGEITDLAAAYATLAEEIDKANTMRGLKAAENKLSEEYYKELESDLNDFKDALLRAGATREEASALKIKLGNAIISKQPIPDDLREEIWTWEDKYNEQYKGMKIPGTEKAKMAKLSPSNFFLDIWDKADLYKESNNEIKQMIKDTDPYAELSTKELERLLERAEDIVNKADNPLTGYAESVKNGENPNIAQEGPEEYMSIEDARKYVKELPRVILIRGSAKGAAPKPEGEDEEDYNAYTPEVDGSSKQSERFKKEKEEKEKKKAEALINRILGVVIDEKGERKEYTDYDYDKSILEIDRDYYEAILKRKDLTDIERLENEAGYLEAGAKLRERFFSSTVEDEAEAHKKALVEITESYANGLDETEMYNRKKEQEELRHLRRIMEIYDKEAKAAHQLWENNKLEAESKGEQYNAPEPPVLDSEVYEGKYIPAKQAYLDKLAGKRTKKEQSEAKNLSDFRSKEKTYLDMMGVSSSKDREKEYRDEMQSLFDVYENEKENINNNYDDEEAKQAQLLKLQEGFEIAKLALAKKYGVMQTEEQKKAVSRLAEWLNSDGGKALSGSMSTITSGMSSIFSGLTSLMQADVDAQTKTIESRYDKELKAAEGNAYKVAQLEKQKEKDIAKVKSEANRRQFVMQVIQAMAQTAQNALSAYGSAAAIPVVGHILAPIAASMAIAAGMLQVAAIKKQQKAAEAGYASGGFTPEGGVNEIAGTVHKGEWVASQKLVKNRRVRPLLEALDYMQSYNTLPALSERQVSHSVSAPAQIVKVMESEESMSIVAAAISRNTDTLKGVDRRLSQPTPAMVSMVGDYGIARAQDDYNRYRRSAAANSKKSKWR